MTYKRISKVKRSKKKNVLKKQNNYIKIYLTIYVMNL